MSCKVFISHSSRDEAVALLLTNFLVHGLGLNESVVFCSSVPGHDIPVGLNFNDYIQRKLRQSAEFYTIAIISNDYYNSKYSMYELGAAWGLSKRKDNIIPFLVDGMNHADLKDFIKHTQAVAGHVKDDIHNLYHKISKNSAVKRKPVPHDKFEQERNKLIEGIDAYNRERRIPPPVPHGVTVKNKVKLVAFDFDGTILQGYKHSWKEIWKFLNLDEAKRIELYNKHRDQSQRYTFKNWCDECVSYFIERKLKKGHIKTIIKNNGFKIATNFADIIKVLNLLGIKTIIISGGIDTFIHETLDESTLSMIECFVNTFQYDENDNLVGVIPYQENDSDGVGKARVLRNYCKKHNIELDDVAFVGDEVNDLDVMNITGKRIAYPASKAVHYMTRDPQKFELLYEDSLVHLLPKILS
jgi:HAD superfamily phosphoserine phosphatase-like hydrolase